MQIIKVLLTIAADFSSLHEVLSPNPTHIRAFGLFRMTVRLYVVQSPYQQHKRKILSQYLT
jgi:hypothetical protein